MADFDSGLPFPTIQRRPSAQLVKTVAASGAPEAISATSLLITNATAIAKKGERTANTGTVHVGPTGTNDKQPYDLAPGEMVELQYTDLANWYVDVDTNGDGVVVIYDR